jgi:hypothetical protein
VFENRVLRKIFEPKRDEVTGGWRKLHNKELYNLYSPPNIIRMFKSRRVRRAPQVARREGEKSKEYRLLLGEPEDKIPRKAFESEWDDNIKIDIREIKWDDMDWIDLAQDIKQWKALVNMVMKLQVP